VTVIRNVEPRAFEDNTHRLDHTMHVAITFACNPYYTMTIWNCATFCAQIYEGAFFFHVKVL
jgi:hypothetical protein